MLLEIHLLWRQKGTRTCEWMCGATGTYVCVCVCEREINSPVALHDARAHRSIRTKTSLQQHLLMMISYVFLKLYLLCLYKANILMAAMCHFLTSSGIQHNCKNNKCSPSWELELRPLGVTMGNTVSVTRVWSIHAKTQLVGQRQPMTSLPARPQYAQGEYIIH